MCMIGCFLVLHTTLRCVSCSCATPARDSHPNRDTGYPRHQAQFRQAMFFSAASVAGAFSGLLAFAIAKMDGVGNLAGWRWIFILEGMLTVLVAIAAYFTLHDFPETATFLTEEERAFVIYRLKYQGLSKDADHGVRVAQDDTFQWKFVKSAFLDWQIWTDIWVYWGL